MNRKRIILEKPTRHIAFAIGHSDYELMRRLIDKLEIPVSVASFARWALLNKITELAEEKNVQTKKT